MTEKNEQPTPKRIRDARARGQLPRSRLFTAALVTAAGVWILGWTLTPLGQRVTRFAADLWLHQDPSPEAAFVTALKIWFACVVPLLLGVSVVAILGATLGAGFQLNWGLLKPKLERVDPVSGFRKLISIRTILNVAKGLVIALLVAWIVGAASFETLTGTFRSVRLEGRIGGIQSFRALGTGITKAAVFLICCGAFDFLWAYRRHWLDLRMSRQEVRDEHKNSEGDPLLKAKRKAMARQLAAGGHRRGPAHASVVVVNPTHLAVALRYAPTESEAPYLVAKGREQEAFEIRQTAEQLNIPVVHDISLAKSLVEFGVGEQIPEELYQAVAAILQVADAKALETKTPIKSRRA